MPGTLRGVVVDDAVAWARRRGYEVVELDAPRGARMTPRGWLEAAAAIEGRGKRDGAALADALLRRAGLSAQANAAISSLTPFARVALAIAETAVVTAGRAVDVVLPEPAIPWPHRHELRRIAADLLAETNLVLHAREAGELASLVEQRAIEHGSGHALAAGPGQRAILLRVYGWGEPYDAFRSAVEGLGVSIAGGPIAHVLTAPDAVGPREILAAAYDAGLDVLEVREALV